jgi:hypothetical protein
MGEEHILNRIVLLAQFGYDEGERGCFHEIQVDGYTGSSSFSVRLCRQYKHTAQERGGWRILGYTEPVQGK